MMEYNRNLTFYQMVHLLKLRSMIKWSLDSGWGGESEKQYPPDI